jgi:hypothetical protein
MSITCDFEEIGTLNTWTGFLKYFEDKQKVSYET